MIETAIELTDGRIPAADLQVILGWGKRMLTAADRAARRCRGGAAQRWASATRCC